MTRHLTRATLADWLASAFFVTVLFGVAYQIDLADADAERLHAMAQQARQAEQRLQHAAQALCTAELGPHTTAVWTADGDLVCRAALLTAQNQKTSQGTTP